MGAEDEDYSYDAMVDSVFEQHGDEYIAERADEIARDFQTSGLFDRIVREHGVATGRAEELLTQAKRRSAEKSYEEALFAAGRALEGYCTATFITPLFASLTESFQDSLPHARLKASDLLGDSLRSKQRFVHFCLLAILDAENAKSISKLLNTYIAAAA